MATLEEQHLGKVLVTGGSGGLASQILQLFSRRSCEQLHSIDLRQPLHRLDNVTYHVADLTDAASMRRIFEDVSPDVVIHTASPKFDTPNNILYKVNVEGTRTLLQIAKESGTRSFVYTSSASVISDAKTDLKGADETFPLITGDQQPEFYTNTKVATLLNEHWQKHTSYHRTELQTLRTSLPARSDPPASSASATWLSPWDFTRLVWRYAGDTRRPEQAWIITRPWALLLAGILEWVYWALRLGEPPLTRTKVRLSCMTRYFCIDKAKKRLGYKPLVGLEEGLRLAVEDCVRRRREVQDIVKHKGQ